jgi:two-component system OmpR family response regulator
MSAAFGAHRPFIIRGERAVVVGRTGDTRGVRVLVVEDEVPLAKLIREGLIGEGLLADIAIRGEDALWMGASGSYDVICLDVNLPGIDGFETCRRLRADDITTPILMLTARDAIEDRINGLDTGADDYLVKPFDFGELLARVRALARRRPTTASNVLEVDDLVLDLASHRVRRGDTPIELSLKEVQILEVFMRNADRALTRLQLLEGAWDSGYENRSNVIDVYVRYLREKIDRPFDRDTLQTVRGVGYRLNST